jgi:mRNA interferase MazF
MEVKKGDIFLVKLDPVQGSEQGKTRPALVIQGDWINTYADTTVILPITSTIYLKEYGTHIRFNASDCNLRDGGTIKAEQIRVVDKSRLIKKIGHATEDIQQRAQHAVYVLMNN